MPYSNNYASYTPWSASAVARPYYISQYDEAYIPVPSGCCVGFGSLPKVRYIEAAASQSNNVCCNNGVDFVESPIYYGNSRFGRRW